MPQLIEHIDAIARQKRRAVLYLEFHPATGWRHYRYQADAARDMVLAWLDAHQIGWQSCGPIADPCTMPPYLGQVYLDVPYDEALPAYRILRDYLELPDGSMRHAGVNFYALPLELADNIAEHDEEKTPNGVGPD